MHGRPNGEIREVTRRIPWYDEEPLEQLLTTHPNFKELDLPAGWRDIARQAEPLVGIPRHLSVHPGGVVIVPTALTDFVPTEPAVKTLEGHPDLTVPVIQFEKDGAEDAGLVKIDLLGNRSLAVIRDAIAAVQAHTGRRIDYTSSDPGDDEPQGALPYRPDHGRLLHRVSRLPAALRQEPGRHLRAAGAQHQHHPSGVQPLHPDLPRAAARRALRAAPSRRCATPWPRPSA